MCLALLRERAAKGAGGITLLPFLMLSNRLAALDDRDQLEAILDLGMRCGAFTVTRKGAFDALPTQADLNA